MMTKGGDVFFVVFTGVLRFCVEVVVDHLHGGRERSRKGRRATVDFSALAMFQQQGKKLPSCVW